MCGEITTVCADCGAERFLFWDECKDYWALYAAALRGMKGQADAKPHPADCSNREHAERDANLGTCPDLENCISKVKLRTKQTEAERRRIAAARARLEQDRRERRYKAAFAKRHFGKKPVPAVPPPATGPSEFFLDEEELRQRERRQVAKRSQALEHQKAKKAVVEMLRRKRKPQGRARGCAVGDGSESQSQDSPLSAQLEREAFEVPDSGISLVVSEPEEAADAPDSGVSLSVPGRDAEELYRREAKPSNASSETTVITGLDPIPGNASPESIAIAERNPKPSCPSIKNGPETEGLDHRQAKPSNASSQTIAIVERPPKPSFPSKNGQGTCQHIEREAAAKGAGLGAALGMVGHLWGRISAGLGIVR